MKRFVAFVGALCLGPASAFAQVNVVPQVGVTTAYLEKQTYSAAFIGLAPAASATDVVCIAGSSSKTVKVREIRLSGSAGTLVTLPVTLLLRQTADTGGTAASTTANPANNIAKRDSNNGTASATLVSYTANPTINDTSPTYMDSASLTLPVTSAGTVTVPLLFSYHNNSVGLTQAPTLRGAAQQLCLNFNAVSVSSGVLNGAITWTEE